MTESPQLKFSVRYRLGEYLDFASEHAFATEESLRNLTGPKRFFALASLKSIATIMFLYKSARVGQCHFQIDSVDISRLSKGGYGAIPWFKVKAVHTYTPGYLIETQKGAMPIPYRVLDSDQIMIFRSFADEFMREVTQSDNSFKPLRESA